MVGVLSQIQESVFWINLVVMASAVATNVWRARKTPSVRQWHWWTVAFLATGYCVSYALFLTGVWTRLQWSEVMIVPSMASIFILWTIPPLFDVDEDIGGGDD